MTIQEYETERNAIRKKAREEESELIKRYVRENAKYAVGDRIRSSFAQIVVEQVKGFRMYADSLPDINYYGLMLTKKLEPNKVGNKMSISQEQVIGKI